MSDDSRHYGLDEDPDSDIISIWDGPGYPRAAAPSVLADATPRARAEAAPASAADADVTTGAGRQRSFAEPATPPGAMAPAEATPGWPAGPGSPMAEPPAWPGPPGDRHSSRLMVTIGIGVAVLVAALLVAALAVDPDHVATRYERGTTLFFLGRYAEAAADLAWAHAQQPGRATEAVLAASGARAGAAGGAVSASDTGIWSSLASLPSVSRLGSERLA